MGAQSHLLSDWNKKPPEGSSELFMLRRAMLVHCYLYYGVDSPVISDHQWMAMAQKLAELQAKLGWEHGFYDMLFKDWDGSTGFHLSTNKGTDRDIIRVAERQLERVNKGMK